MTQSDVMKELILLLVWHTLVWSPQAEGACFDCQATLVETEPFLIFINTTEINRVNIDGSNYQTVVTGLKIGIALDYDYLNHRIYWTDTIYGQIRSTSLSTRGPQSIIVSGLSMPEGLAIDWVNDKLYWTDRGTQTLEQSDLSGNCRIVLVNATDEPRGIALDPMNDALYMTDWGASPRIEKMHLDGSGRVTIVTQNLVWPNAVTIDFTEPALYWADAFTDIIARGDLDGNNVVILLRGADTYHPFGVTVFGDYLYWTDWSLNSIERISKHIPDSNRVTITSGLSKPSGIRAYPSRLLRNGGVTHLINMTYRSDLIIVTWDPASSPYCGEVLYYQVVISSDEHVNIPNSVVNITCLTNTFLDLRSNTTYTIMVTAVNRAGCGLCACITVDTAADMIAVTKSYSNQQPQFTEKLNTMCDKDSNDHPTGAAVAISIVVTFIITLVVTTLISVIITRLYYKHQPKHEELSIRENIPNTKSVRKQNDQEGIDCDGYVITQRNISGDCAHGQLYDVVN